MCYHLHCKIRAWRFIHELPALSVFETSIMSILVYIIWRSWKWSKVFKTQGSAASPILKSTASRDPRGPRFCPRQNEAPPHHEVMTHVAGTTCLKCILASKDIKTINKKPCNLFRDDTILISVISETQPHLQISLLECLIYLVCSSRSSEIFVSKHA